MVKRAILAGLGLCLLAPLAPSHAATAVDQAIGQLVGQLEDGAPDDGAAQGAIRGIAIWQWLDDKLPEPVRRAFRDDLEIALINSPRFTYFNRDRFRQILREHQTTLAQLADPAAMKAFAAAGIDGFLSIEVLDASCAHPDLKEQDAYCVILAKLTDAKTAAVAWADFIEGTRPAGLKTLLGDAKPVKGTTRYRELAALIADSLQKANPLADAAPAAAGAAPAAGARLKAITLSTPSKDGSAGIGIQNPINAAFDTKAFQDELLVALARTRRPGYVDPTHIARLAAAWSRDSEATAAANKKALAGVFALDGYLFGEIRSAEGASIEVSMRLVRLADGSEAWAGKFTGTDTYLRLDPRTLPEPPVPRDEPKEPAPVTLDEIERPLKPPVPQPDLAPLPDVPTTARYFNPLGALLYAAVGLPRDALDTTFQVADRVPLLGAATSALYRYAGLSFLCRAGTEERFVEDVASHRALTYGQLASSDPYPSFFPLVASARKHPGGTSDYILQLSLGTLTAFDLLDATYSVLDHTPLVGTLATPVTLPLNYAWRSVPDDRAALRSQVSPGSPESRLTYGSLDASQWSLLPNARSWAFTFALPWEKARSRAEYAQLHAATVVANEQLLKDWLAREEERRKYNDEALKTLRERNAKLRQKHQQGLDGIRRGNDEALQRYQADKKAAEEHNARAKAINAVGQVMPDLIDALTPTAPRPAPAARPKMLPAVAPRPPVVAPAAPATPATPATPMPVTPRPRPRPVQPPEGDGEPAPKAVPAPAPKPLAK